MVVEMASENKRYIYRVIWSEEDKEFVGLCTEFPSLSWLADTQAEALRGINEVVAEVVSDMESNGETIPIPLSDKNFSGNFTVRIPPETHRKLAMQAAESRVSINRLVSVKLAAD